MMYLRNYRLQKALLLKCLRRSEWEHLSTVNMLKSLKQSWNMQGSSFVISLWKSFSSTNSFLSQTLRLFDDILTPDDKYSVSAKVTVHYNQFKCYYQEKPKKIFNLINHFWNLYEIFNILKQKMSLIADVFFQKIDEKKRS